MSKNIIKDFYRLKPRFTDRDYASELNKKVANGEVIVMGTPPARPSCECECPMCRQLYTEEEKDEVAE